MKYYFQSTNPSEEMTTFVRVMVNRQCYSLLREMKYYEAIKTFKINTELFPDHPNPWDSLAEGYLISVIQQAH